MTLEAHEVEIVVMSDDKISSVEFLSWMMGKDVLAAEERFLEKHGDQTICLLDLVDDSLIEKYMLNDECLYLFIARKFDAPIANRSHYFQISGEKDQWSINGASLTTSEMWTRLGEWQKKQYSVSISRIAGAIPEVRRLLEREFDAMKRKRTFNQYSSNLEYVKEFVTRHMYESVCDLDRRHELKLDMEDKLKTIRLEREIMKPGSKAKWVADIKDRIVTATREGSPLFIFEKVFNEVMDEYVVQDATALCEVWYRNVQEEIKTELFVYLEEEYGYLDLCAELQKQFEIEFTHNLYELLNWIKTRVCRETFASSSLFNEVGQVNMDGIERARSNTFLGAEDRPWQPKFISTTEIEEIIAYEMFAELHAVGTDGFTAALLDETQKLLDFKYICSEVINTSAYTSTLYACCDYTCEFKAMKDKCSMEIELLKSAGEKFQRFKRKLLAK